MNPNKPRRILSGVKPTGRPHIGNYFGAMRQFVDLQNSMASGSTCYFMIADYHTLNFIQNRDEMARNIIDLAIDYLAIGLDPAKSTIFQQSSVPAHTELAWIFDTITTMPYLMRAHAFKDAEAKDKEINVGTFNYPMLMAADILLYDVDVVPVGQDQKQHVEYTRDTAQKFNHIYGETFRLPEAMIIENVAVVPGIDGRKMSKSYDNTIPLFAEDDVIDKQVMSIVTDSSTGIPANVRAIHSLFRTKTELDKLYADNAGKYKVLKDELREDIKSFISPMREKRKEIATNLDYVKKVLTDGAVKANFQANNMIEMVRDKIGVKI